MYEQSTSVEGRKHVDRMQCVSCGLHDGMQQQCDDTVRACPDMQDAQVVAYFLHVRVRKPEHATK